MMTYLVKCSACAFETEIVPRNAWYENAKATPTIAIHQTPGWCANCNCACFVEVVESIGELQDVHQRLLASGPEHFPRGPGNRSEAWLQEKESLIEFVLERIGWRSKRMVPPRCLTCASTEYALLPTESADSPDQALVCRHQNCAGVLVAKPHAISLPSKTYLYTAEGVEIK